MKKKIALLGATGSIGSSTLEVIRNHPDKFDLQLIASNNNIEQLLAIAAEFNVPFISVANEQLKSSSYDLSKTTRIFFGESELKILINDLDLDIVVNSIAGSAGLKSTMNALYRGLDVALANKESLVMAGHLVNEELARSKSRLLPVDSEHCAVFQCINKTPNNEVDRIILTASGGPFRFTPLNQFDSISLEQTLKHPTWDMGAKITVDSATMMNKGLEVIEAHWLFNKTYDKINAVIHPQSVIHSLVEFLDGTILAQVGVPNMQLPILYALTYPEHIKSDISRTDLLQLASLNFLPIEKKRFPLYYFAVEVGKTGGLYPTIMNAANEAAIKLFTQKKIKFNDIFHVIENVVSNAENVPNPDLETIVHSNTFYYNHTLKKFS